MENQKNENYVSNENFTQFAGYVCGVLSVAVKYLIHRVTSQGISPGTKDIVEELQRYKTPPAAWAKKAA